MPLIGIDEEPDLDLGKESVSLPKIRACLELQTPHHPPVRMLAQIYEDLRKGWACLAAPGRNAAIGRGEGSEGSGRAQRSEEGEGDSERGGRKAGCLIQHMAGYWMPTCGIGGTRGLVGLRYLGKGCGFAHAVALFIKDTVRRVVSLAFKIGRAHV